MPRPVSFRLLPALGAALLAISLAGCDSAPPSHAFLPWDMEINQRGHVEVFGITLGESSLLDFSRRYGQKADLAMFAKPGAPLTMEAYFGRMNVGPLTARVVLVADVSPETLERWAAESTIADPTPSGARKLSLSDEALQEAQHKPIRSISYAPSADYSEALITRRFGEPSDKRPIPRGEREADEPPATLWLYPEKGLAITVESDDTELFQYINPEHFDRLVERTLESGAQGAP